MSVVDMLQLKLGVGPMRREQLAPGRDTAAAVAAIVEAFPGRHEQSDWVNLISCNTTRCIAGWTVHVHGYSDEWIVSNGEWDPHHRLAPVAVEAARLLQISDEEAYALFYSACKHEALNVVKQLAAGQPIAWGCPRDCDD